MIDNFFTKMKSLITVVNVESSIFCPKENLFQKSNIKHLPFCSSEIVRVECTNPLIDYVKIPIDFCYFFFCSPFRLKIQQCTTNGVISYKAEGYWPQRLLAIVLTIVTCFSMLRLIGEAIPKDSRNPRMYFCMFRAILSELVKLLMIANLWLHQNQFPHVANFVCNALKSEHIPAPSFRKAKVGIIIVCLIYTAAGMHNWIGRPGNAAFQFNMSSWWSGSVVFSRKMFFLPERDPNCTEHTPVDIFVGLAGSAGLLHRYHFQLSNLYYYYCVINLMIFIDVQ